MKTPRFTVGSVSGYHIADTATRNQTRFTTVWYVHDSALCYRIVQEFRGRNAENRARNLAQKLNTPVPKPKVAKRRNGIALCRNGHEQHLHNVYISPSGHHVCRVCAYDREQRYRLKKKQAAA